MVLEMADIGNHALHLLMDRNMDAVPAKYLSTSPVRDQATIDYLGLIVANPFANLIPGQSLNGATVSRQTLLTPYPEFTGITLQGTNAASSYFHSMDVRVEKRMSHGLSVLANFTYSKLIARDNYKNATDTQPEKRVAADDRPLRLVLSGSYTLPFGKGTAVDLHSGFLNRIVGGWNLNGIYVNQVGAPLTFGSNLIYYGGALNNNPHPANLDAPMFDATRFNTNSAQQLGSSINTFGTRYGSLRQDGGANVDLSLIKNTAITEKVKLQFRFEAKLELDLLGDGGVLDQREIHVGGSILAQAPVPGPERVDAASQLLGAVGIESRGVEHGGVEIGRVRVVVQRAPVVDE